MARTWPSSSATIASSPIGVLIRSMSRVSNSARGLVMRGSLVRGPQMLRGIGAPRPPGLRPVLQDRRRRPRPDADRSSAQQADVAGRECIGLAYGAQRDVVRRPFADAADRAQPLDRFLDRALRLE